MISMICAMDRNSLIGANNRMPWHLSADMQYFKRVTMGKPMIMGRKTWESLGRVLPGRRHIVITRRAGYGAEGIEVVNSVDAAVALIKTAEEAMVIGGAQIYEQLLPAAQRLYLTCIDAEFEGDTWFPEIDPTQWRKVSSETHLADEKNPYDYRFEVYERLL